MPWMKQAMIDVLTGRWGDKYEDEIAAVWFTRGDVEQQHEIEFTDAEWEEISGRFNNEDWQYIQEEVDDIITQVLDRRENPDG